MSVPTYSAGRRTIEELARTIRPAARNWPIAATQAILAVKRKMPMGATNRFMQDRSAWVKGPDPLGLATFGKEVSRVLDSFSRTREIDKALESWNLDLAKTKGCTDPARIAAASGMGELAIMKGAGNCQYQGAATVEVLKAAGVRPLDLIYIFTRSDNPRHAVTVIGIPKVEWQNEPSYAAWRDCAVLADTWETEMSEPAIELGKRYAPSDHRFIFRARRLILGNAAVSNS
jgi:hypothetical protein